MIFNFFSAEGGQLSGQYEFFPKLFSDRCETCRFVAILFKVFSISAGNDVAQIFFFQNVFYEK